MPEGRSSVLLCVVVVKSYKTGLVTDDGMGLASLHMCTANPASLDLY